jgi:hypothetical protein
VTNSTDRAATLFSVIIEWENAKLSEFGRARSMLQTLAVQTRELDRDCWMPRDLVILYDPAAIDRRLLEAITSDAMGAEVPFAEIKIVPAGGMRYYQIKNFGVAQTNADVIVLLDSDVIPQPGWLQRLLESLWKDGVDVVGGNAYVTLETLYSRAFALFWFFPLRTVSDELRPSETFFANNVAFRKPVFDANPFPQHRKFRGQCTDLAVTLKAKGFGIYVHEGARVSHPPPNGTRHFISRALCAGYDQVCVARSPSVRTAWRRCIRNVRDAYRRIATHGAEVALGLPARVIARAIALAYYAIFFVGECITLAAPRVVPKYFPV